MNLTLSPFMRWLLAVALLTSGVCHAQVGSRQIRSGDMAITLVYPTATPVQSVASGPFTVQVAKDAAPSPAAAGSRRLIVLSHGTAGHVLPDHDLAATLVRAGFAVAQPLHRGDNYLDFSRAGPESWKTRPQEVSETIDAVAKHPVLGPQLDLRHVGVHGMSAGGVTGLVLAGGQWRLLNLVRHCAQHLNEDIGFCLNGLAGQPVRQALRKSQFAMSRWLPDSAGASMKAVHGGKSSADPRPDPRVAAVSLAVPVGVIFTADSLARITIPVALTRAGNDLVLVPAFHSDYVLANCLACTRLSDHPLAGHFDGLSPWPHVVADAVAATQIRGGLPSANFSVSERQQAFEKIAFFFRQQLTP